MLASELINEIQSLIDTHGDKEVCAFVTTPELFNVERNLTAHMINFYGENMVISATIQILRDISSTSDTLYSLQTSDMTHDEINSQLAYDRKWKDMELFLFENYLEGMFAA